MRRSFLYPWLLASILLLYLPTAALAQVERHLICQGCKDTKPSVFFLGLKASLEERIDFTTVTCIASEEDELNAVEFVRQRKLNQPNAEIHVVATLLQPNHCESGVTCADVNLGANYIPLLRAGVRGWFIEDEPHFEALGVNRTSENLESTELFPDNSSGGKQIGHEFCRVASSIAPANIVVLYGSADAPHSTARIHGFIKGMQETCPEAGHVINYAFYADWSAEKAAELLAPVFLKDGSISAVIAANDDMALGALVAEHEVRPDKHLVVAGYDANSYTKPLLESDLMFATVDQNPPSGLVNTLEVMLSDKATGATDFGSPNNCSLSPGPTCSLDDYNKIQSVAWKRLSKALPNKISTDVAMRVRDASELVIREKLLVYNPAVLPPTGNTTTSEDEAEPVEVLVQMKNFDIYELDAAAESTSGHGLMLLSWKDIRLSWSLVDFPDVEFIHVDINKIWHPYVVIDNLLKSGSAIPVQQIQTTVYPDGSVVWEQNINAGEFRCASIDDTVLKFPFDSHRCGVDLTQYSVGEFTMVPTLELPPEVAFDVHISNDDWAQGSISVELDIYQESKFETLHFRVGMSRNPMFVVLSLVVPSFILNMISFAQFWIPTQSERINLDRGGMAITTILAALALREAMVSEVDTAFTLLDLFMLISLCFHFIGFLITAYESSYGKTKRDTSSKMGFLNRMGKLTLPIIFGLCNIVLSIFWANGIWELFYLSVAEIICVLLLNRKDQNRMGQLMSYHFSSGTLRERVGWSTPSRPVGDEEAGPEHQENIVRYMRWRAVAARELGDRTDAERTAASSTRRGTGEPHGTKELGDSEAQNAALTLQRYFRKNMRPKSSSERSDLEMFSPDGWTA